MIERLLLIVFVLSREVSAQCICGDSDVPICLMVRENEPIHTVVGRPATLVKEGLMYTLSNENSIFTMNQTTSQITTLQAIDREGDYLESGITQAQSLMDNNYCFSLGYYVNDGATRNLVKVNIQVVDVNDNRPTFTQPSYSITVTESMGTNDVVPKVCDQELRVMLTATDIDEDQNAIIVYSVEGGSLFRLEDESIPCVQSNPGVELDRDTPPSNYSFILFAQDTNSSDRSQTNVTYMLSDINDNQPFFENSTVKLSIKENLELGTFVYQFQAHDIDSGTNGGMSLTYSYSYESTKDRIFEINETSGILTISQNVDAEVPLLSPYTLIVSATDMGRPPLTGTAEVTIVVEDINEPATFQITNTKGITEGDDIVVTVAVFLIVDSDIDPVNKENKLSLVSGQDMFSLKPVPIPNNKAFSMQFNGSVDYEQVQYFQLALNLTEEGNPILHKIIPYKVLIVDANDNAPSLNQTWFYILEGIDLVISLGQYTYDLDSGDNGEIGTYRLVSVLSQSMQDLTNNFAGLLTERGLLDASEYTIDREVVGDFLTFVVNVTDNGKPPQSKLNEFVVEITDVNDNAPVFQLSNFEFHIREGEELGTEVGQVFATDSDFGKNGMVRFAIHPPSALFTINETTGVIRSKQEFDRESDVSRFIIAVKATDRGTPSALSSESVPVTILITDVNDNSPIFVSDTITFRIDTNFGSKKVIGGVIAIDADASSPNKLTWYQIQKGQFSSMFSIRNNASGNITLETYLSEEGNYTLNISAFNPGKEESGDSILVTLVVFTAAVNVTLIGIASGCVVLVMLIIITGVLVLCICLKNRKSKQFDVDETNLKLSMQNSILKIPAANGSVGRSGRVTFKERVEEAHYDVESIINNTKKTIKKESVTKFDNSLRGPHSPASGDSITSSPISSSSPSNGQPGQSGDIIVLDLETRQRKGMNGDISGHCQYDGQSHHHSPITHPSSRGLGGEMIEYSQGTSSDGQTSNNDLDDEESMYSDDASIVNTALSRFGNNRSDLEMPYETPSTHSHLELHRHLPHMSHGQHTHSSSLAQLHAHNQAQLAKGNTNGAARPQYGSMLSPERNHSLNHTHPHDTLQHQAISNQSFSHSPPVDSDHMEATSSSKHLHVEIAEGGRNFTHPLVMPDAFPRDGSDVHRFPIDTYADYGEASTYASTELDEALGFNLEAEPGIISLTADYEEDTVL